MSATITDINEHRMWKRAKSAWRASNPPVAWEALSEEDRVAYKRAFENADRALRGRTEGR